MSGKHLNVDMRFTADTSQAKNSIQELNRLLDKALNQPAIGLGGSGISAEINKAKIAATELKVKLQDAMRTDGSLDLVKFNSSLQSSGKTLGDYGSALSKLGTNGKQAFLQLTQSISTANISLERSNGMINQMWTTLKNVARFQISSSVIHTLVGGISTAYNYAQNLNESLNNIRIVTNQSAEEMSVFADRANKAARNLSATTLDYTNASLIYYQQGLTDEEVAKRTETTLKLANVSRQSAEMVSDQMTAIWNNFSEGATNLEYYADVITALGAATASSSNEIATGVSKFAAIANTVGLSYEYATTALATLVAETRQSADTVGNSLRTLFTRFQSLKMGDTLEDGTGLTKYSEALATAGVNIKEQNGELKGMDQILNELGAKWQTLNKDQQVALAQTVGGVRQYVNLIALMDNWDTFQKNLTIAEDSEGTLDKQAQIYAESWEAARDRVKAAAEAIYQSLIDDDFFIGVDNFIEKNLNGINNLIKALGGLPGVLSVVGTAFFAIFGPQLSTAIDGLIERIKFMSGTTQNNIVKMKQDANNQLANMYSNSTRPGDQVAHTAYSSQANFSNEILKTQLDKTKQLSAEEQRILQLLQEQHNILVQNTVEAGKETEQAAKRFELEGANTLNLANRNKGNDFSREAWATGALSDIKNSSVFSAIQQIKLEIDLVEKGAMKAGQTIEDFLTDKKQGYSSGAAAAFKAMADASKNVKDSAKESDASVQKLIERFIKLTNVRSQAFNSQVVKDDLEQLKNYAEQTAKIETTLKSLNHFNGIGSTTGTPVSSKEDVEALAAAIGGITESVGKTEQELQNAFGDKGKKLFLDLQKVIQTDSQNFTEINKILKEFYSEIEAHSKTVDGQVNGVFANIKGQLKFVITDEKELDKIMADLRQRYEELQGANGRLRDGFGNLGASAVTLKQYLAQVKGELQTIGQSITAVAGGLSGLASFINTLKGLKETWNDTSKSFSDKMLSTAAASSTLIFSFDRMTKGIAAAPKLFSAIGSAAESAGRYLIGAASATGSVAAGAVSAGTAIATFAGTIIAVIAIIGGFVVIAKKVYDALHEDEIALANFQEATEELGKKAKEAKTSADNLKSSIDKYDSAVEKLKQCTEQTKEWKEAFDEVNIAASGVLETVKGNLNQEDYTAFLQEYLQTGVFNKDTINQALTNANERAANLELANASSSYMTEAKNIQNQINNWVEEVFKVDTTLPIDISELMEADIAEFEELLINFGVSLDDFQKGALEDWFKQVKSFKAAIDGNYTELKVAEQMNIRAKVSSLRPESAKDQDLLNFVLNSQAVSQEKLIAQYTNEFKNISNLADASDATYKRILATLQSLGYNYKAYDKEFFGYGGAIEGNQYNRSFNFTDEDGKKVNLSAETLAVLIGLQDSLENIGQDIDKYDNLIGYTSKLGDSNKITRSSESAGVINELLSTASENGINFADLGSKLGKTQLEELIQAYNDTSDDRISEIDSILQKDFQINYNDVIELILLFGGNFDAAIKSIIDKGTVLQGLIEEERKNYSDEINQILDEKNVELDITHAGMLTKLLNDNTKATIGFEEGLAKSADVIKYIDESYAHLQEETEKANQALNQVSPNFTEIYETLDKIKNGVLKADDYQTLMSDGLPIDVLEEFFIKTSEGVYMLIGTAEDLKAAVEQTQIDTLVHQRDTSGLGYMAAIKENGYQLGEAEDFDKLKNTSGISSLAGNTELTEEYKKQADALGALLALMGDWETLIEVQNSAMPYSVENLIKLAEAVQSYGDEWAKLPESLDEYTIKYVTLETQLITMADSLGKLDDLSKQYGLSNDAIANGLLKLGSSYDSCNAEVQAYQRALKSNNADSIAAADSALRLAIRAGELAESAGASANDVERLAKSIKDSTPELKTTDQAYVEIAKDVLRFGEAVKSAESNMLKWQEAVEKVNNTGGFLDISTANQLAEAYGNMLDIDGSQLSNSFLSSAENLEKMKTALEGVGPEAEQAYNELRQLVNDEYNIKIKAFVDDEFWSQIQTVQDEIAGLPDGVDLGEITINGQPFLDVLTEIVNAAEQAGIDATDYLSSMGIDANIIKVADKDPHTNTYTGAEAIITNQPVTWINPLTGETQTSQVPSVSYRATPIQTTDETSITGYSLQVVSANKSSGGHTKIINSGGGTGPITPKSSGGGSSKSPSNSSSSSSSKSPRSLTKHAKADASTRYHVVKEHLSDVEQQLSEASHQKDRAYGETRLKYLESEIALRKQSIELQKQQTSEMQRYLEVDKQAAISSLKQFGLKLQFDENGVITNYEDLYARLLDIENSYIDQENMYNSSGDDIPEYLKDQIEAISDAKEAINQYESTLNGLESALISTTQAMDELNDALLEQVTAKVDFKLDFNNDAAKLLDYYMQKYSDDIYSAAEAMAVLGQQAINTFDKINAMQSGVKDLIELRGISADPFKNKNIDLSANDISQLRSWRDELISSNLELLKMEQSTRQQVENSQKEIKSLNKSIRDTEKNIKSLEKQIKEAYEQIEDLKLEQDVVALEKINEKLTKQNELIADANSLYSRYANILQTYKDITNLMGRSVNREQEKLIDDLNNALLHNSKNTMIMAKRSMEELARQRAEAERLLGKALNENNEDMVEKYKDILKQMDKEVQNYEQQYLTAWQNTLNQAQQMFETTVDNILDNFDTGLSGVYGSLDYLKQAFDRQSDIDGQYLKDYDKLYELNKMQRDLNKTLSNTTNADTRADLLALQKQITLYQQQGVQLSKYDIDALKAKIALQQSYNDLQVSQNAKNTVRLTRDAGGNWGYVYTANSDNIARAEQAYEDKLRAYQKLNDDYLDELQNKVIEVQTTYRDYLKEILTDVSLSDVEREARIKELNNWLNAQQEYFNEQSQGAFNQQSTALAGMSKYYKMFSQDAMDSWGKTKLAALTGTDSLNSYMDMWSSNNTTLLDDLTTALQQRQLDLDEILQLSGSNIISWGDTVQNTINSVGESSDNVTISLVSLSEVIDTSFAEAIDEYSKKIADVREQIDNYNDSLTDAHDSLTDYIDALAKANDKLAAAQDWQWRYANQVERMIESNERFIKSLTDLISALGTKDKMITSNDGLFVEYYDDSLFKSNDLFEESPDDIDYYINNQRNRYRRFASGGYTGEWGPEGKLAILDEKEQVFNADDTENLLEAATILRKIDLSASSMMMTLSRIASPTINGLGQTVQQEVHIEASFPNATDHYEIEEAFNNLSNKAIQYVNRKNNL